MSTPLLYAHLCNDYPDLDPQLDGDAVILNLAHLTPEQGVVTAGWIHASVPLDLDTHGLRGLELRLEPQTPVATHVRATLRRVPVPEERFTPIRALGRRPAGEGAQ